MEALPVIPNPAERRKDSWRKWRDQREMMTITTEAVAAPGQRDATPMTSNKLTEIIRCIETAIDAAGASVRMSPCCSPEGHLLIEDAPGVGKIDAGAEQVGEIGDQTPVTASSSSWTRFPLGHLRSIDLQIQVEREFEFKLDRSSPTSSSATRSIVRARRPSALLESMAEGQGDQ
jgi:hypothetical protein